jgi:hypothetical protein
MSPPVSPDPPQLPEGPIEKYLSKTTNDGTENDDWSGIVDEGECARKCEELGCKVWSFSLNPDWDRSSEIKTLGESSSSAAMNPHVVETKDAGVGITWQAAKQACSADGALLCSKSQLCVGVSQPTPEIMQTPYWVPVATDNPETGFENGWVQYGAGDTFCTMSTPATNAADYDGNAGPTWDDVSYDMGDSTF